MASVKESRHLAILGNWDRRVMAAARYALASGARVTIGQTPRIGPRVTCAIVTESLETAGSEVPPMSRIRKLGSLVVTLLPVMARRSRILMLVFAGGDARHAQRQLWSKLGPALEGIRERTQITRGPGCVVDAVIVSPSQDTQELEGLITHYALAVPPFPAPAADVDVRMPATVSAVLGSATPPSVHS